MNSDRRRKRSDEVKIKIEDSEDPEKNYWNLRRGEEYHYNQEESPDSLNDEISIEFNLNEDRELTEEQKQVILNTLLTEPGEETEETNLENIDVPEKWKYLLFVLILAAIAAAVITVNNGC